MFSMSRVPGAANITTAAGDTAIFVNEAAQDASGSNWRCWSYQRASGSPLNAADLIATQANQETGSSTTLLVTSGRQQYHQSAAKAWVYFDASSGTPTAPSSATSYNVTSITDGGVGIFTPTWTTAFSSTTYVTAASSKSTILNASNVVSQNTTQSKATTGQPLTTRVCSTDAAADTADCSIAAFGDQ